MSTQGTVDTVAFVIEIQVGDQPAWWGVTKWTASSAYALPLATPDAARDLIEAHPEWSALRPKVVTRDVWYYTARVPR